MLCVKTLLRREEEVIKVHIENVKHLDEEGLERKLKDNEAELTTLLDEE